MVCSTVTDSEKEGLAKGACCAVGIAPGDYRLVGWDMDTTGKKVIDEICQIATYTPSSAYSQYVMPYKDLNPTAIKRHSMKVVTNGKFRVLRHSKTNEVIKSKSEVSALTDFLSWLETEKGDADGIILVYHEPRKVIPAMLLESLKKYDLVDRFKKTVKGFANGFNIAEQKCANSVHVYSLRTLSRTLLKKEGNLGNAQDRASLALQVVQYLCWLESKKKPEDTNGSGDTDETIKKTVEFVREFAQSVDVEEQEHDELKMIFERQNNLRPIFSALFRMNRRERQHASPLRRLLAEAGIEYSELQEAWTNEKKDGLEHLLKEKLPRVEEKKIDDLLFILERHFDPEKKPKAKEIPDRKRAVRSKSQKVNDDKENNNKCDSGTESPDTTTSGSPAKLTGEEETKTL
ncbi:PREDICTED: maternal protein exuperantia [Dinoponera quadriceps]|uniref:Maternal protein exuperantia n=1 Tax=Dinoponera quadriceps TaxID=609295 RepID=A0A6P3X615_DINQU|nr:PREDICTED: maternal protein exuperantia [Dinoponera quadriceps]XP_014473761.1 PREDICTED: maternal protein exuperantia [Dinoponera quadriceps]XP_014473762.1 PREDICTED: maternal protein exuperantia [Dinoponera quadriceps]XP_014473763.1 PREDICTED: maternal protein exuperantia [Dinoponera quadriceps]XP_014473764.1 PREDICTED: maternal protein exuperantia [Dinoponera quadriceps]XP_014473765.1 PREDICTED: maternal protein exuperantia [Dinoponera quadriceps]XP_014473766.1 PREDICTED: maternal protei